MENVLLSNLSCILYCFVAFTSFIAASVLIIVRPLSSSFTAKKRLAKMIGDKNTQKVGVSRLSEIVKDDRRGNIAEKTKSKVLKYKLNRKQLDRLKKYLEEKLIDSMDNKEHDIEVSIAVKSAHAAKERLVTMVKSLNREYEGRSDCNENSLF